MKHLALLGKDIQHSKSQFVYESILDEKVNYTLFDYPTEEQIPNLETLFSNIEGLSITSPYKRVFLKQVKMTDEIKVLNAINCIKRDGSNFIATNTDYLAMNELIVEYFDKKERVFILGDGAMGNLTKILCEKLNISYQVFSRKLSNLDIVDSQLEDNVSTLIINSCARSFIFNQNINLNCLFWDLNYNMPEHQSFFQSIKVPYIDGMSLLELQAKFALSFWNNNFS